MPTLTLFLWMTFVLISIAGPHVHLGSIVQRRNGAEPQVSHWMCSMSQKSTSDILSLCNQGMVCYCSIIYPILPKKGNKKKAWPGHNWEELRWKRQLSWDRSKARFDCNIPLESVSGIHTHNSGCLTYSCSLHIYFITGLSPCIVLSCTVMKPLDIRKCYYLCFHPRICNIVHNH